jgi:hypothetical protein
LNISKKSNVLNLPLSKKTHEIILETNDYLKQHLITFKPDTASCVVNNYNHVIIIDPVTKHLLCLTQKNNLNPMLVFIMTHSNMLYAGSQKIYSSSLLPHLPHLKTTQALPY